MHKPIKPSSLHQQIRQLQQQMAKEQVVQQQQHLKVRDLLVERLTSWPVLLGAVATGIFLSQIRRQDNAVVPAPGSAEAASGQAVSDLSAGCPPAPEPTSFWHTLFSLPLLTQGIWWLAEQVWYSRLFRDVVRQKLLKSDQRHPPY